MLRLLHIAGILLLVACGSRPAPKAHRPQAPQVVAPAVSPVTPSADHLKSGLNIIAMPQAQTPVIALRLFIPAGAAHGEPGAAHAIHRLIRQALTARVNALGATVESWNTIDASVIELNGLVEDLPKLLNALAAEVQSPTFDAERLARLAVIADAEWVSARSQTGRTLITHLLTQAFDGHPLGRPALPGPATISALSPKALQTLHQARYRPQGSVLIATGPIDRDTLADAAQTAFSKWSGSPKAQSIPLPDLQGPQVTAERGRGPASIQLGFRLDAVSPEDAAELDLLAALLQRHLIQESQEAGISEPVARAFIWAPTGAGVFIAQLQAGIDADIAWDVANGATFGQRHRTISTVALGEARAALISAMVETDRSTPNAARRTGLRQIRWSQDGAKRYRAALSAATTASIGQRAKMTFQTTRMVAHVVSPRLRKKADPSLWAEAMTERARAAADRPAEATELGRVRVTPDLEVILHPAPAGGDVALRLVIPGAGASTRAPRHRGAHRLVAAILAGAQDGEPTFHAELAPEHLALSTQVAPHQLESAIGAILRRVRRTRFTVDRIQAGRRALDQEKNNDDERLKHALLYHLHGLPVTEGPSPAPTPTEMSRWYSAYVKHAPVLLIIAGHLDPATALAAVRRRSDPEARPRQIQVTRSGKPPPNPARIRTDNQAHLAIAFRAPIASGDALAVRALLAELITRPAIQAEVPHLRLRAYPLEVGPRGALGALLSGPMSALKAGRAAVLTDLNRLQQVPADPEEIAQARKRVITRSLVALNTPTIRAKWLAQMARGSIPWYGPQATQQWRNALERVTPSAIRALAETLDIRGILEVKMTPRAQSRNDK